MPALTAAETGVGLIGRRAGASPRFQLLEGRLFHSARGQARRLAMVEAA
jgi:hypothetical protein